MSSLRWIVRWLEIEDSTESIYTFKNKYFRFSKKGITFAEQNAL
jgi:hypothetical protein